VAIERVNSRLRHWFARFRRRTCVVSKALDMVNATIALFAAYHVNGTTAKLTLPLSSIKPATHRRPPQKLFVDVRR
jgi:insertion element IS1 protein InsB